MHYNENEWEKLENSGVGYDFYDGKNLKVREFDNGKSYLLVRRKGKQLFYIENTFKLSKIEKLESKIENMKKDIEILENSLNTFKSLHGY